MSCYLVFSLFCWIFFSCLSPFFYLFGQFLLCLDNRAKTKIRMLNGQPSQRQAIFFFREKMKDNKTKINWINWFPEKVNYAGRKRNKKKNETLGISLQNQGTMKFRWQFIKSSWKWIKALIYFYLLMSVKTKQIIHLLKFQILCKKKNLFLNQCLRKFASVFSSLLTYRHLTPILIPRSINRSLQLVSS